ncbi:MAG: neutral/alkaline non-lysosomal ceramidase N-terminal domain-containing protein [Halioglobus sp.]
MATVRSIDKIIRLLLLFCCSTLVHASMAHAQNAQHYLIGRGSADITGPAFGVQMWGFGRPDQIDEGIHIRQRARAFVIAEADDPANTLVFVSADLGSIDHHITLSVVEDLQQRFGNRYNLDNVIISATHTHAAPGGYWQTRSPSGLDGGLYPQYFEAIVAGITASIVQATDDLQPGTVFINSGHVANAGANRSAVAYLENPPQERARYSENTNTEMLLLKFVDDSGAIGMINWYALHPTAMNFYNHLISGDHKGYASLQMERQHGATYQSADDFVAAFAQSDDGDVTPNMNLDNTGPGSTDVETTRIMGERQLQEARNLFAQAKETLHGPIDSRRMYVDFSHYEVEDHFTGTGTQHTCPSAYGYSFAGGSTEDGGGHFLFREGMTEQSLWRDWLIRLVTGAPKWTEAVKICQAPKPILFETGTGNPPLQSQIHSVTVARIGQLVILALPAEVTTMAGRRLRDSVMNELGDWARYIVVAGYANGFAGYVTTPQEYMLQQYEGGHNLHGRWSLPAYQQVASQLASALQSRATVSSDVAYDDWRGKAVGKPLPGGTAGSPPEGKRYGDALPLARTQYHGGETIVAEFWSANPTAHYTTGTNTLLVEKKVAANWQAVASDSDWSTRVRWRVEDDAYIAQLSWDTPVDTLPGDYRLTHFGYDNNGNAFNGVSEVIHID